MNPVACQPPVANSSLPMRTVFHSRSTFETILRTRHVGTKRREEERESGGGSLMDVILRRALGPTQQTAPAHSSLSLFPERAG